jgi:CBS-domain-containing membrane protein
MTQSVLPRLLPASYSVLLPNDPASRILMIDPDAPANLAMTDFRAAPVVSTRSDTPISAALAHMKQSGARFAFVVGNAGELLGSVTSYDIQGEKPMQYMNTIGCSETTCAWADVQVGNIMEPVAEWRVLEYAQVVRMSVSEMLAMLTQAGLRYLVVVEGSASPQTRQIRGLFSASRLQALMGSTTWMSTLPRGMTSVMAANNGDTVHAAA